MKTVVCGLGKCGSRMIVDLNAMIFGGKFSYQLKVSKDGIYQESIFNHLRELLWGPTKAKSQFIPEDEVPRMHLGDPDNANEVINYCIAPDEENKSDASRKELKNRIIQFGNYHGACGQYHIIGETVMLNLLNHDNIVKQTLLSNYISKNSRDNATCFLLMFSAGGGTGCGTSTVLAEYVAEHAKKEYANLLVAGIAALPGLKESDNYKVSAGRFLTKFLSSDRATSFDTVITVGNSIMEDIERDQNEVQSQANIFAANIILSLVNSSSKYNRSPVNTDGPELRKNIRGLSWFCYAQSEKGVETTNLDLVARALGPVSTRVSASSSSGIFTGTGRQDQAANSFQGASINFIHPKFFPGEKWESLVEAISSLGEEIELIEKGDQKALEELLAAKFPDPKNQLPLAMRSCDNVVVLRGIPNDEKSSSWEQTILVSLLETLFPKATIHYYSTYHGLPRHTLSLLPSGYISYEIVDLITAYLANVWETDESPTAISKMLFTGHDIDGDEIRARFGDREMFERKYPDFSEICERTSGLFGLTDEDWEKRYVTADNVASMIARVQAAMATAKRKPKVTEGIDWEDEAFNI